MSLMSSSSGLDVKTMRGCSNEMCLPSPDIRASISPDATIPVEKRPPHKLIRRSCAGKSKLPSFAFTLGDPRSNCFTRWSPDEVPQIETEVLVELENRKIRDYHRHKKGGAK